MMSSARASGKTFCPPEWNKCTVKLGVSEWNNPHLFSSALLMEKTNNKRLLLINSLHKHNPSVWKINKLWFYSKRSGTLCFCFFSLLFLLLLNNTFCRSCTGLVFHQTLIDCRILQKCIINLYLFCVEEHWSMEIAFLCWLNSTMLPATAQAM